MNTNVVAVVFVSVLLCGVVGVSVHPQTETTESDANQPTTDEGLGGDISVFMQRGAAETNGSVDSGMWLAAFESAENQSRKQALLSQRIETLSARLVRLERRINGFSPVNRSVTTHARRARLVADRDALQTSISEAKTTAASEGVNTTGLDRLGNRIENLSVPRPANDSQMTTTAPGSTKNAPISPTPDTTLGRDDLRVAGATYCGP